MRKGKITELSQFGAVPSVGDVALSPIEFKGDNSSWDIPKYAGPKELVESVNEPSVNG